MTQDTMPQEFDRELDRRIRIITAEESDAQTHRRTTGLQFGVFVGVTLLICLIGAGVAAL